MLYEILYSSVASHSLTSEDLIKLGEKASRNNVSRQLTGCLIYYRREFIQLLEGPYEEVQEMYDIILKDPRHTGQNVLWQGEIEKRSFETWSMGFVNLDEVLEEESDIHAVIKECLEEAGSTGYSSTARQLLQIIREERLI